MARRRRSKYGRRKSRRHSSFLRKNWPFRKIYRRRRRRRNGRRRKNYLSQLGVPMTFSKKGSAFGVRSGITKSNSGLKSFKRSLAHAQLY